MSVKSDQTTVPRGFGLHIAMTHEDFEEILAGESRAKHRTTFKPWRAKISPNRFWKRFITVEMYRSMQQEQEFRCAICGCLQEDLKMQIDHCHEHGHTRGLLCKRCNAGLGFFKDKPEALRAAAEYIEKHAK